MALTPKQQRFVDEYLKDLNATAAYKRAGYAVKNDNAAGASASALLRNPKIAEAVKAGQQKRAQRTELSADWVIRRLREESELAGEGSKHAARIRALELLGKHIGLWKERPALEELIANLPVELGDAIRAGLAALLQPGGVPAGGTARQQSASGADSQRPDDDHAPGGPEPRPVAEPLPGEPVETGDAPLFPAVGEEHGERSESPRGSTDGAE